MANDGAIVKCMKIGKVILERPPEALDENIVLNAATAVLTPCGFPIPTVANWTILLFKGRF
jgi:hypothetical protein